MTDRVPPITALDLDTDQSRGIVHEFLSELDAAGRAAERRLDALESDDSSLAVIPVRSFPSALRRTYSAAGEPHAPIWWSGGLATRGLFTSSSFPIDDVQNTYQSLTVSPTQNHRDKTVRLIASAGFGGGPATGLLETSIGTPVPAGFTRFDPEAVRVRYALVYQGVNASVSATVNLYYYDPFDGSTNLLDSNVHGEADGAVFAPYAQVLRGTSTQLGKNWRPDYPFELLIQLVYPYPSSYAEFQLGHVNINWR